MSGRLRPVTCDERDALVAQEGVIALGGHTVPGVHHVTDWGFPTKYDPDADEQADGLVVRDEVWPERMCEHWVPAKSNHSIVANELNGEV